MIAAIGITVVDHILMVDGFHGDEGSYHFSGSITESGGMAAAAMCAAARLSGEARLFSRIGDDPNGRFLLDRLRASGVDTAGVVIVHGAPTVASYVLVDSRTGEKQFYSPRDKEAYREPVALDMALLDGCEALLVDGHWMEAAVAGAAWAREHGVPVVADFKRAYPGIARLFPLIDYFIVPRFFAEELTGGTEDASLLDALTTMQSGLPVVTGGAHGGMYLDDGEVRRYRAFPVDCVDSTGAGDAFHGAFCHFLVRGAALPRCLELASATGAMNCRAIGGRAGLPTAAELAAFLTEHGADNTLP